jgi:hypothetical protein
VGENSHLEDTDRAPGGFRAMFLDLAIVLDKKTPILKVPGRTSPGPRPTPYISPVGEQLSPGTQTIHEMTPGSHRFAVRNAFYKINSAIGWRLFHS